MSPQEVRVIDQSENEVIDFTYSITSYGADYPVDSLVKRLRTEKIKVPSFQRKFIWTIKQASRFIESLLLGLPVPGIFLAREVDSADLLVIDGQQRLKTLQFFYDGMINEKAFRLVEVQERFEGKTYKDLESDDRQRLDDSIIHATIVKQDEPSDDYSSIYYIFERLNTGGVLLSPQEIRSAIYAGDFFDLLKSENDYMAWREVYGPKSPRLKDQEFILRFMAMFFNRDHYRKPLKGFLNTYMAKNRNLKINNASQLSSIFRMTVDYVETSLGKSAFRPKGAMNASIFDSVMVGIAEMISRGRILQKGEFVERYNNLLTSKDFIAATTEATSDEPVVIKRMLLAINAFTK